MFDHLQKPGITAEKVLPEIGTTLDEILLVLTVADLAQTPYQQSVAIILDQVVPVCSPDRLNHIPTCAAEDCLEFLDDLAIAANRAIETLQVAIDHENQIVQPLTGRQRDRTQRLGFVHFSI